MASSYFPVHAHSEYSLIDGIGTVDEMVRRVAKLKQPGLALTDHGLMSGVLRLYKLCRKEGIVPFPGEEWYVVGDHTDQQSRNNRYHMGMLALDYEGFKILTRLSSASWNQPRFYRKPLIDMADLSYLGKKYGQHIAVTSGCASGLIVRNLREYGDDRAKGMLRKLAAMFPNLYVEVQWHGVYDDHDPYSGDAPVVSWLLDVAHELSLPVVFGQDSHYCEAKHQEAHNLMKNIGYFSGDADDNIFDGGPYHLASTMQIRKPFEYDEWCMIEEGHADMLAKNKLSLPALDNYQFHVPDFGGISLLKRQVMRGLEKLDLMIFAHYEQQARHELYVIEKMGFASYFLMMERILSWARKQGIFFNVRGSANGSLCCYALGITNVDPIKWGLYFDRFLSLDRKKPPDVDVDVESSRRAELIDYVRTMFPALVPIGTYGKLGLQPNERLEQDRRGSLIVQYMAAMRKRHGETFNGKVDPEHWPAIEQLAKLNANKSAGTHAAGYVLPAQDLLISDYLATMTVGRPEEKDRNLVTQAVMEDVEDCGYVKADFLGLQSLTTMRLAMEAIGKDPVTHGMGWIPDDDPEACAVLRSGQTTGIFQFEGYSTLKGARQMKVASTYDAIVCLALFRPAMMGNGMTDRYLECRKRKRPYSIHPTIDKICKDTWGVPVFQDQVIEIMRKCGLSFEDLNDIIKAVKASNDKITEYATAIFERVHPIFVRQACTTLVDCDKRKAEEIWDLVMAFDDYGFNKEHATAYGLLGYRMAYMKVHHTLEFMWGLLASWTGKDKEATYYAEAKRLGLKIARADINLSEVVWSIDHRGNLRRGLVSVDGIGFPTAELIADIREEGGPFTSAEDLAQRLPTKITGVTDLRKGNRSGPTTTIERLRAVKALESVGLSAD